jgi:hypothetical protein
MSYDIIYNMPIWLRNYTFNKLKEWYNQPSTKLKKMKTVGLKDSVKKISIQKYYKYNPPYLYVTKASKK